MKHLLFLILCVFYTQVFSQEIPVREIKTEVNEATVFFENAQITRKKTVDLLPGTAVLKFVNLSPFIDAKSIQVKADGEVTVLTVNHQQNFIDKLEKSQELASLENTFEEIERKINLENTYLAILKEELVFLQENRAIGGKNQEINVANLKETANFYSTKLTTLKLKEIELYKTLNNLLKQKKDIDNQIKTITSKKEFAAGEILVKINAKKNTRVQFELSYVVQNAGWFPSYDIRAKNINEPVEVIYKANVKQDTKEDWNNIKLKLSSSNPNISGVAPELKTYFLDYNSLPPTYGKSINLVKGKVTDSSGP
ncbi:MAG: mucoidy inhibitor MuiA family protein, partial [Flavobacteriaceae bacterium]|nr:mucoidy inhibitor MuiA family protein [Flavobacteriaceae bacterium]